MIIHATEVRTEIERRIRSLRADTRGRWGTMTVDQMLWHCNQSVALSLGEITLGPATPPLPRPILRLIALRLPWMKNAPTHRDLKPSGRYDFEAERQRLLALLHTVAARPLDDTWPGHPAFGRMTGHQVSALLAKHLDHHLRQFGH